MDDENNQKKVFTLKYAGSQLRYGPKIFFSVRNDDFVNVVLSQEPCTVYSEFRMNKVEARQYWKELISSGYAKEELS